MILQNLFMFQVNGLYLTFCPPASPIDYLKNPDTNFKSRRHNLLGLALECCNLIAFDFLSEVYGDPLVHPQTRRVLWKWDQEGYDEP
jgi:hypothetical protein